jgi:hypothetical protein
MQLGKTSIATQTNNHTLNKHIHKQTSKHHQSNKHWLVGWKADIVRVAKWWPGRLSLKPLLSGRSLSIMDSLTANIQPHTAQIGQVIQEVSCPCLSFSHSLSLFVYPDALVKTS